MPPRQLRRAGNTNTGKRNKPKAAPSSAVPTDFPVRPSPPPAPACTETTEGPTSGPARKYEPGNASRLARPPARKHGAGIGQTSYTTETDRFLRPAPTAIGFLRDTRSIHSPPPFLITSLHETTECARFRSSMKKQSPDKPHRRGMSARIPAGRNHHRVPTLSLATSYRSDDDGPHDRQTDRQTDRPLFPLHRRFHPPEADRKTPVHSVSAEQSPARTNRAPPLPSLRPARNRPSRRRYGPSPLLFTLFLKIYDKTVPNEPKDHDFPSETSSTGSRHAVRRIRTFSGNARKRTSANTAISALRRATSRFLKTFLRKNEKFPTPKKNRAARSEREATNLRRPINNPSVPLRPRRTDRYDIRTANANFRFP